MIENRLATYETAPGFILDWHVAGFFPGGTIGGKEPDLFDPKQSRHWTTDHLRPWGGEEAVTDLPEPRGLAEIEWLPLRAPADYPKLWLDRFRSACPELESAWPEHWDHQWYALALVETDRPAPAELRVTGQDGCRAWFNGRLVVDEHSWHKLPFDLHVAAVDLRAGRNAILLKLDRFGLVARLTGPGGRRLAGRVRSLAARPPRPRPHGTFDQLTRYGRKLRVTSPCPTASAAEYRHWRKAALAHFRKAMGPMPQLPARRPRKLVETVQCDGYVRHLYRLTREAGSLLPVHVLVPEESRFNGRAVICPHGHGQDDKVVAGIAPPRRPYGNWFGPFTGNYAELLAQNGFITATWAERTLSHERKDTHRRGDPCNLAALSALAMSMTLPGLNLFDLHGVADLVCALPGVRPERLGLTGLSGGGTITYLAGAYDDRFRACAVFCGIHSYARYVDGTDGCGQQIVPHLYPTLDVGELLCLIAPRPLLLGQGQKDVTFATFVLRRFARQARRAYRLLGAGDALEVRIHDRAHQVDIDAAADFFLRNL
jgi:hypothetical protein